MAGEVHNGRIESDHEEDRASHMTDFSLSLWAAFGCPRYAGSKRLW